MDVHIGKIIKDLVSEKKLTAKEVAEFMNMTKSNLFNIYSRASVDIDKLGKFSALLEHNLFEYYLPPEIVEKIFYKDITQLKDQNGLLVKQGEDKSRTIADKIEIIENQRTIIALYKDELDRLKNNNPHSR